MVIVRGTPEGFLPVSSTAITRTPVRVAPELRSGWHTLIVQARGKGDVLMRFDGQRYPGNPSMQPKASLAQVNASHVLIPEVCGPCRRTRAGTCRRT